jgi:hypothetical protein
MPRRPRSPRKRARREPRRDRHEQDDDQYFLPRAFASRAELEERLTASYGSDEWR